MLIRSSRAPLGVALFCLLSFLGMGLAGIAGHAPTMDETVHLAAGWSYLRTGDFRINPEHPPLVKTIAALPLQAMGMWPRRWNEESPEHGAVRDVWRLAAVHPWAQWVFAHRLFYAVREADIGALPTAQPIPREQFHNDVHALFAAARLLLLLISGVGLFLLIFTWSRALWGAWGAALSTAFFCFDPNLVGHLGLITTDGMVTLLIAASIYFFWRLQSAPRLSTTGLVSVAAAVALAHTAKYSALVLWPMLVLLALIQRRRRGALAILTAGLCTWAAIWISYGLQSNASSAPFPTDQAVKRWYESREGPGAPAGPAGRFLQEVRTWGIVPDAYLHGLISVQADAVGREIFLRGVFSGDRFPHYFLWTFLLKTPLPSIAAMMAAAILIVLRRRSVDVLYLLIPILFYLAVSMKAGPNIGHRHILPLYPFLYAGCGVLGKRWFLAAGMTALSCIAATPHQLSYYNALAGAEPHRQLIDSNIDWGQDLKRLGDWYRRENLSEPLNLVYFGSAEPRYEGIPFINLGGAYYVYEGVPLDQARLPGLLAISVHDHVLGLGGNREAFDEFLKRHGAEMVHRPGRTISVYRLRIP